jgi:hypothetical protein
MMIPISQIFTDHWRQTHKGDFSFGLRQISARDKKGIKVYKVVVHTLIELCKQIFLLEVR